MGGSGEEGGKLNTPDCGPGHGPEVENAVGRWMVGALTTLLPLEARIQLQLEPRLPAEAS